jgi:hypothetical protein
MLTFVETINGIETLQITAKILNFFIWTNINNENNVLLNLSTKWSLKN